MKEKHQRNINVCLQAFTNGSAEAGLLPDDAVGSKGELVVLLEGRGGTRAALRNGLGPSSSIATGHVRLLSS